MESKVDFAIRLYGEPGAYYDSEGNSVPKEFLEIVGRFDGRKISGRELEKKSRRGYNGNGFYKDPDTLRVTVFRFSASQLGEGVS